MKIFFLMNRIGNNIRYLRSLKNVNQIELGKATGIKQSKISRIETGGTPDHHEAVVIANYFMLTAEMLLNEDLTERFKSKKEWEDWTNKEGKAREIASSNLKDVGNAPLWIKAILEHYSTTIAQMKGEASDEILQQVEAIFQRLWDERHELLKGTSYDKSNQPPQ